MTPHWDCAEARVALGVYVLGIIDPAERALVDAHLATCEACAAELAELDGLPGMLALVPAEEAIALAEGLPGDDLLLGSLPALTLPPALEQHFRADQLQPGRPEPPRPEAPGPSTPGPRTLAPKPAERLASVHDLSAARRRRRLAAVGSVAAAAVVIGAASFGGVKLAASPAQPGTADPHPNGLALGQWQTVMGSSGQAMAIISYQSMGWGVRLDAQVSGIPVGTPCQLWLRTAGGQVQAGSWHTDTAEGSVWYGASADVPTSDIKAFVITVSGGQAITVTPA
jgi:anti-sigma factor RsiW